MKSLAERVKNSKPEYITKPHIGPTEITGYVESKDLKEYKGATPFIAFDVVSDEMKSQAKFWLEKAGDDQSKITNKLNRIQRFLEDIGVDVNNTDADQLFKAAIGKRFLGAFKEREYLTKDTKNQNKPIIRSRVELAYSSPLNKPFRSITINNLFEALPVDEYTKYEAQLEAWNAEYGHEAPSTEYIENVDLSSTPKGTAIEDDEDPF